MPRTKTPTAKPDTSPNTPKAETPATPPKKSSKVVWILLGVVVLILLCCTVATLLVRLRRVDWLENWRDGIISRRTEISDDLDTDLEDVEEIDEESPEEPAQFDDLWVDDPVEDTADEGDDAGEDEDESEDIPEEEEIDPPVAPSELRFAEFMPVGSVTLIWNDNSHNEDGFRIQRMSGPTRVVGQDVTQMTYSDDPECGETYRYRVYGYNDGGKSPYSNVLTLEGRCP